MSPRSPALVPALVLCLAAGAGAAPPTGRGVPVAQVEGPVRIEGRPAWLPAPSGGRTVASPFGAVTPPWSPHATAVGRRFYGADAAASGITRVTAYGIDEWLGGFLRVPTQAGAGSPPLADGARVVNHSWVAQTRFDAGILRRVDWVVARDEVIQVAGLQNGGRNQPLLASAFNVITVGRSDGRHATGSTAVDEVYTGGRARPEIVAPAPNTSLATPMVASAAAVLVGVGHTDPALSTDPVERSTSSRSGARILNAERAEVIRAVLLAGAARQVWESTDSPAIQDYRLQSGNRTDNGLDRRYGAGQLDLAASLGILTAGEQNSLEDAPGGGPAVGPAGFDYDPRFGGAGGSNEVASYELPAGKQPATLRAALVWHLSVDGGSAQRFSGEAQLHDLDLHLIDVTEPQRPRPVATSASRRETTENLFHPLEPGHRYQLQVRRGPKQRVMDHDYGLAWLIL